MLSIIHRLLITYLPSIYYLFIICYLSFTYCLPAIYPPISWSLVHLSVLPPFCTCMKWVYEWNHGAMTSAYQPHLLTNTSEPWDKMNPSTMMQLDGFLYKMQISKPWFFRWITSATNPVLTNRQHLPEHLLTRHGVGLLLSGAVTITATCGVAF